MARLKDSPEEMVRKMLSGDRRAASRLITVIEDQSEQSNELMKLIYPHANGSMVIGVTGFGGSGKSTLTDHLIHKFRQFGKRVGVVAVDPSSPFSGGALLRDRIRFQRHALDEDVYIRSMGSRGYLGGLARATNDVVRILEAAGFDVVIVETLGVGQDEIDVIHVVQTCLLILTPGMGDDIQAMKAGLMEIADIIVLNKADLDGAETCLRSLEAALQCCPDKGEQSWIPKVLPTVARASRSEDIRGIDELIAAILDHQSYLQESKAIEELKTKRIEQELALVFKDEVEGFVFKGLRGTGKKQRYIKAMLDGKTEPYSVVEEVLGTFLKLE